MSATNPNENTSYFALAGSQEQIPGPPGPQGEQGEPGPQGVPGVSVLSDVVPPTAAVGNVNDLYVDLVTSQLYKKTDAATWTPEFSMIGATGTPATAAVGITTTVAPGQPANVTNTGTPSNAIFNFAIPAGAAATIAAGTVTTLAPGTPATVTNTGTPAAAVFAFGIPQGEPGSSSEATWSNYPAISDMDLSGNAITNASAISAQAGLALNVNSGNLELAVAKDTGATVKISGGDLDISGQAVINATGMSGAALSLVSATGDITLTSLNATNPTVGIVGSSLDLGDGDVKNVGSITAGGVTESATFGQALYPMLAHNVFATNVQINSYNPISAMNFIGVGGVNINAPDNDINLNAGDINLTQTQATSAMNLTALGAIVLGAGGAIDLTAGGAVAINAAGTLQIVSTGNVSIGSGNVLGADTEVEKFSFKDNEMYRNGSEDLTMSNVKKISNSGDGTNTLTVEATNATLTLQGTQTNVTSLSNGNVIIAPQGTGTTRIGTGSAADVVVVDATGKTTFSTPPACAVAPTASSDLTNLTYVDGGLSTKLPNNADITLTHDLGAPAATPASAGPYLQVAGTVGTPTGVPTVITGCVPLYVDTTGGGKLYAFFSGVWNAI